ncbi:endonuclease/exonuclease/phosphatase family protein [Altererythrobacter sp. BO-6]|uniref:endonuclease/exonuclease/phosphatase family protein n=1 Tax=Altererythrobacter sp. BO-6 TaxID=2604537 RepID=UPI0013E1E334|nr:endonuclease/exonuclease/phosphatase family protein [Altererythrobacter sp. BO-6]QIG54496.1 endonuclease/exonuclease/phosphatase family protein [Altererythrobacter sp. BO-6]
MAIKDRSVTISTWNLAWATPGSDALDTMLARLASHEPQIICLTEGYTGGVPDYGYVITGEADWGYSSPADRRKVMLWSKSPWREVDQLGHADLPSGRFVSGVTDTDIGPLRMIGVCIPWRDAHVRTGRRDREPWQDHLTYLDGLGPLLEDRTTRTVLLGDFNQRMPRRWSPEHVYERLVTTLGSQFEVVSRGRLEPVRAQAIDHIAISSDLRAEAVRSLSNTDDQGRELSDHFGVSATISVAS